MQNRKTEFITFLEQFTTIVSQKEYKFGLQLDFEYQNQVRSIFFHEIIPNKTSDLKNIHQDWIIWEDLWILKKSVLKSSIAAYFGNNKTIHGRKTSVKSVPTPIAKEFLEQNHLFSISTGKYRLGLFENNNLVGLMTFSAGRNWKERQGKSFEIIRFCNHKDVRVHGGFSKLLKAFIKQKNPVQLMTYADTSWYQSTMYEQFGFQRQPINKSNSFWISTKDFSRQLTLSENDHIEEWMKVVNYESYKFTWES